MASSPPRPTGPARRRGAGRPAFPAGAPFGAEVPAPGDDVCARCHGPGRVVEGRPADGECWCCRAVGAALGEGPEDGPPVAVVALCRPGDALHAVLRRYKDAPGVAERRHHTAVLARTVDGFLAGTRSPSWWPSGVDAVATVPSSTRPAVCGRTGREPASPLEQVLDATPAFATTARVRLGRGTAAAGHLRPAAHAFVAPDAAAGRRVVLVEDTWVTGARARSAAASLSAAGAVIAGVLVIGRCVDPGASAAVGAWWERHT